MFNRVLVSLDLSPATEALVSSLPYLGELGTKELILAHVTRAMQEPISGSIREQNEIRDRLTRLGDKLSSLGFDVSVEVRSGAPAAELVRISDERSPDLILVGSRSHTRIREAFVGSVAWELVRRAHRPILLHRIEAVRPDPEAALESRSSGLPERILFPTDFSETADGAIPWIQELVRAGVGRVTLMHALPDESDDDARSEARDRLDQVASTLSTEGAEEVKVEVRKGGAPHEQILSMGGRDPSVMVVMGTHGRGVIPEIVLGSESRQVVRQAAARVLLIPSGVE